MINDIGEQLWAARISGNRIPGNFGDCLKNEEQAYVIQKAMIVASREPICGWKIGATAESLFDVLGVKQPFLGPLFNRFTYDSGTNIPIQADQNVETEMTVRLNSNLPPRNEAYNRIEIKNAIAAIHPSFEIVGVRFEGEISGAGPKLIADGGGNIGTVLANGVENWADLDLMNFPVSLSVNGKIVNEGNTSALLWDHIFDALIWCLNHRELSERGLCAGDIIMTGTCTGITPISPGDKVTADFGQMGKVNANFT